MGAGVSFCSMGAGDPFDSMCVGDPFDSTGGPCPDAIAAGAWGRRGVGCTATDDGPSPDAIATEARILKESGGRTPSNAGGSSHSIAAGARGHGQVGAGPSWAAIAKDDKGRERNGRPTEPGPAGYSIIVINNN